ncbi:helix-turn-helix transcriptional regulator [Caulobacter sp. BP25]|uniref:helix-turn-helix transcriptional regulator n=1 Tax=Caulobacter sp. BP25 TaxID=2048900 RepID=UPI003514C5DE
MTKSVQEPSTPGRNIWTNAMTQDVNGASKRFIPPARPTRPIRREQLRQLVPLSDTTIYGLEMQGRFPRRFNLTNRCVAWDLAEVEAWVEQRRRESLANVVAKSPAPDVRVRRTRPVKAPGGQ